GFELVVVLFKEAGQTAKMIVVTVAQDKGIKRGRIDAYEIGVVDQRVRCEAEIDQDMSCFGAAPRLDVHRQSELADQRLTRRLATADAPAEMFNLNIGNLPAWRDSELIAVDDHAHRHTIDLWNLTGDRFCAYRLPAADQRRHDGAEQGSTAAAYHVASMNCVALAN